MTEMLTMIVDPVLSTDSNLIFSGLHNGGRFFMFMTAIVALVYAGRRPVVRNLQELDRSQLPPWLFAMPSSIKQAR